MKDKMHHTTKRKDNKRVHIVAWDLQHAEFFIEVAGNKMMCCTYAFREENWGPCKNFPINPALVGRE